MNVSGADAINSPRELELDRRFHRHVEKEERQAGDCAHTVAGGCEERCAAGCRRRGELIVEALQEPRKVGSAERELPQCGRLDARHRQIVERARERARESGRAGDSAEVGEALVLPGVECGACGDGFRADERGGRDSASGQDRRREPRGELREAEAMQPGGCSARHRHSPRQVVGRAAGGRHDERAAIDAPPANARPRADERTPRNFQ